MKLKVILFLCVISALALCIVSCKHKKEIVKQAKENTSVTINKPSISNKVQQGSKNKLNPTKRYDKEIAKASVKTGVPEKVIKGVINTESKFNKNAVSPDGCLGLMQLSKWCKNKFAVTDPFNAEQNINAGAELLKLCLAQSGDLEHALTMYKSGKNNYVDYNYVNLVLLWKE